MVKNRGGENGIFLPGGENGISRHGYVVYGGYISNIDTYPFLFITVLNLL